MPPSAAIPSPEQGRGGDAAAATGFLVLDKSAGLTSHDCVSRVRRAYGLRRVGHGGTLDPAVTGVLPIALGPATRLLPYLPGGKSYCGWIQLGLRTSSDDLEGEVLGRWPLPRLDRQQLEQALDEFRGAILQRPPSLSALHVQGERAHVRVRRGEQLDLPPRPVTIERLDLLDWQPQTGLLQIGLDCSAGTYVRALARDLGDRLACGGALAQLRRTAALGFQLAQAVSLEQLPQRPPLLEPLAALAHLPCHRLSPEAWELWRCGRRQPDSAGLALDQAVAVIDPLGALAGIGRADGQGWIQPRLVFGAAG